MHKKVDKLTTLSANEKVNLDLHNAEMTKQMRLIHLTDEDLKALKYFKPFYKEHKEKVVDDFYSRILSIPELKGIITEHSTVKNLQATLERHILEMLDGNFNQSFIDKRMSIARIHNNIKLETKWYLGAFSVLKDSMIDTLTANNVEKDHIIRFTQALSKVFNFEQQLVLEAYGNNRKNEAEGVENAKIRTQIKSLIGESCENLASATQQIFATMQELVSQSTMVQSTVTTASDKTNSTHSLATEGYEQITDLRDKVNKVSTNTKEMHLNVSSLSKSSKEIQEIVNLVKDIASQTHLLSLNSAIEAARAGEHGKGFAVVSQEVRKLSEQTKNSVTKITELVTKNSTYIDTVVSNLSEVDNSVEDGKVVFGNTQNSFNTIVASMESNMVILARIVEEINTLVQSLEEVGEATKTISETADILNDSAKSI